MKIAIVYKSITGNTKLLAEAIKEEIPKNPTCLFWRAQSKYTSRFIYNRFMDR